MAVIVAGPKTERKIPILARIPITGFTFLGIIGLFINIDTIGWLLVREILVDHFILSNIFEDSNYFLGDVQEILYIPGMKNTTG